MKNHARPQISEAVVLMAGWGSRLRTNGATLAKPLIPVLGRPLICYILETIIQAGIEKVYAVVGYESAALMTQMEPIIPAGLHLEFVHNAHWQKQNGLSVLAAAGRVTAPFLLTMSDHLYDAAVTDVLTEGAVPDKINIAIDRKLSSIFDMNDAMKVRTHGDQVVAIAKDLAPFDAIDTGMFVCPENIFDYLERARVDGDCSLADGIRLAAADGRVQGVDVGDAWWQDVDTPEMLAHAERHLLARPGRILASSSGSETRNAGKR